MKTPKKTYEQLGETLSRRVCLLREMRNLTALDLARACRFSLERIQGIESGQEIWLSVTDRTKLARALGVLPSILQEVESSPAQLPHAVAQAKAQSDLDELAERVLAGQNKLACPNCGTTLRTSVENALDFEGRPTQFARAYCPSCPFALR